MSNDQGAGNIHLSTDCDPAADGRTPAAGEQRWTFRTPLVGGGQLFLSTGLRGRTELLSLLAQEMAEIDDIRAQERAQEEIYSPEYPDAYAQRNRLVALLAAIFPSSVEQHQQQEGEEWEEGWGNVVIIDLPSGQISFHIHDSEMALFVHLPRGVREWDGHDNHLKWERVLGCAGRLHRGVAPQEKAL